MASSLLAAVDDSIDEFSDFESAQTIKSLENQIFDDTTKIICGDARTEKHSCNCAGDSSYHDSVDALKGSEAPDSSLDFITHNISQLLQETFPYSDDNDDSQVEITELEQHCSSHWLWSKLEDVDCIPQQQWEDSRAFHLMLRSLKIDSRNILQLCVAPIIPNLGTIDCFASKDLSPEPEEEYNLPHLEVCVPEVQFDWTCSGMTNPLENELCLVDTLGDDMNNISAEKRYDAKNKTFTVTQNFEKCNGHFKLKFPDLSFMQSKILSIPFQRTVSNHYGIV